MLSRKGAKEPQSCPSDIYRHRNLIERCWADFLRVPAALAAGIAKEGRLKKRRTIAMRYENRRLLCCRRHNRSLARVDQVDTVTRACQSLVTVPICGEWQTKTG